MRYTFQVDACAMGGAVAVILWSLVLNLWQTRRARRLCPGPSFPAWKWCLPWRWFLRRGCGYDLSGLRAAASGALTCPECGRHLPSIARALPHARLVRWQALSLTLIALTWSVLSTPMMRNGRWIPHVPDWALIAHHRLLGNAGMGRLEWELQARLYRRSISPEEIQWLIPGLIHDLRSGTDDLTERQARWALVSIGRPAMPRLEDALLSTDRQQKYNAAAALRDIHAQLPFCAYPPSPRLLRVTAEGLRSDSNASLVRHGGVDFLIQYGEGSAPVLMGAMQGDDEQARLLAAGIAGMARLTDLLPIAAPILIEHLKDNAISDDAKFASAGLLGFGPDVVPYLEAQQYSADPQLRSTSRLIALDLVSTDEDLPEARRKTQVISTVLDDPARSGGPDGYRGELPTISRQTGR